MKNLFQQHSFRLDFQLKEYTLYWNCKKINRHRAGKNSEGINEVQTMYIDEDEMEELLKDNLKQ